MSAELDALLKSPPEEVTVELSLGGAELTFRRWLDSERLLGSVVFLCVAPAISGWIRMVMMGSPLLDTLGAMLCSDMLLLFFYFLCFFVGGGLFGGLSPFRLPGRKNISGEKGVGLIMLLLGGPLPLLIPPVHAVLLGWGLWLPLQLFTHDIVNPLHLVIGSYIGFLLIGALLIRLSLRHPRLRLTSTTLAMLGWREKQWSLEGLEVKTTGNRLYINSSAEHLLTGLTAAEQEWLCAVLETASERREDALEDAGHDLDTQPIIPEQLRKLQDAGG